MSRKIANPVLQPPTEVKAKGKILHEEGKQWYFWEETWAHRQGPFKTEADAEMALYDYCKKLG